MGLFGAGDPPCPAGSICSGQARTFVGKKTKTVKKNVRGGGTVDKVVASEPGTGVYHSSATKINSDGTSSTDVYIIKDNKWQKAATTNDGGKSYTYDDDVAGAGLKNELNNPQGGIHKNIDAGVNKAADKAGVPPITKKELLDSNKNKAIVEQKTGDTSTPSAEPPKNRAGTRENFGSTPLSYPITRDNNQHIIKFDMLKYEPKKVKGTGFSDRSATSGRTIGTVTLPIPGGISDANACDWGDDRMGPLQLAAAGLALNALNVDGSGGGIEGQLGDLKNQLVTNNAEIQKLIGAKAASAAVGSNENALFSRTQGTILNPNLELIFNGPSLRPFTFQFKMSPRSDTEAKEIAKIIRFFKQGMAPIREDSRLFLKTPHTFKIKYVLLGDGDEENPYLNKFKECALLSCSVQYTPEGNYAPYEDGAMSSYQMSLQFKELEPVYNDDYGSDGDLPAEIGF